MVGGFNVKFASESTKLEFAHYHENLPSFTKIHENAFSRLRRQMIPDKTGRFKVPQFYFGDLEPKNEFNEDNDSQLVAFIVTGDLPLTLEVMYESKSADPERPNQLR